jgi:hypothetical protein
MVIICLQEYMHADLPPEVRVFQMFSLFLLSESAVLTVYGFGRVQ